MRFFPAAVALCASSALAASTEKSNVIGKVTITAIDGFTDEAYVSDGECKRFPHPAEPIREIVIDEVESVDVKCTFYTRGECEGEEYGLHAGHHGFSRPFFVSSYACYEV
ncbi:hypothetical protein P170DRAFT_510169 [Aspergillus terreus]|uniref:Uncharacterized protein n=1 Tax=Aspergillus terreus TaxID=33178 RepID=A0A5M3YS82_ASPTE|nr:hypothetical protein ATETN484_0001095100 [Aspergillus terreus]GFF12806.1 hypothetical protein P170DRAFT_510169 [Aspergillus terreus]